LANEKAITFNKKNSSAKQLICFNLNDIFRRNRQFALAENEQAKHTSFGGAFEKESIFQARLLQQPDEYRKIPNYRTF
jgi:hypothetical protein